MMSDAAETEILTIWFSIRIPSWIRQGDNDHEDSVRIRWDERMVYYKWKGCHTWMRMSHYGGRDVEMIRLFQESKLQYHEQGPGIRAWFRRTYSISLDLLDEGVVEKWMLLHKGDKQEDEK